VIVGRPRRSNGFPAGPADKATATPPLANHYRINYSHGVHDARNQHKHWRLLHRRQDGSALQARVLTPKPDKCRISDST
jgi:hypothetical protein